MYDFLKPEHFKLLVTATHMVACGDDVKFDAVTPDKPSLAIHLGHLLQKMACRKESLILQSKEKDTKALQSKTTKADQWLKSPNPLVSFVLVACS